MTLFSLLLCCLLGYAIGNFSPAFLLGRRKGYDVRVDGSGNVGATNAFLLLGHRAFFITALLDIFKAFAAFRLSALLFPGLALAGPLGGVACILGHMYPVVLGFRGGRGLASLGGVILAWSWKWFLLLLALAILVAFLTRYVCLVAPLTSLLFPCCHYWQERSLMTALVLLIPAVPIFCKHWENFVRIRQGTELRTSFIWNKEGELKRAGKWNDTTREQLSRRGK